MDGRLGLGTVHDIHEMYQAYSTASEDGWRSVLRPRQHSIGYMGDSFYRCKDSTNSIKVLKGHIQYINNRKIH